MKLKPIINFTSLFFAVMLVSCSSNKDGKYSRTTNWAYNDKKTTGFVVKPGFETKTPSGMVAIEGGQFTMGEKGEFITAQRNNMPRKVTVSSFYMDQYEIRNVDWREYTNWMKVVFGRTAPKLVEKALPDYKCWREEMAYNEPYLENYFDHPAFDQYPVVGISWDQAMDYCAWRTDRVNELALVNAGVMAPPNFASLDKMAHDSIAKSFVFNTQKYLHSNYKPAAGKNSKFANRKVDRSDGLLVADYRLPTEAEWEFAAYAVAAGKDGFVPEGRLYPWSGYQARNNSKRKLGNMNANFVRGRGDMMGTSGVLNDKATITSPVNWYTPNDFGLYNMAGNVNEWVLDVYRSTTFSNVSEYNSFRGNQYKTEIVLKQDSAGKVLKVDSLGRVAFSIQKGDDVRSYKDGDPMSQLSFQLGDTASVSVLGGKTDMTDIIRPKITDKTRVYKGGSWKDRIFWLNPSARRYLDEDKSANDIGFRCAMSMTGNIEVKTKFKKKK